MFNKTTPAKKKSRIKILAPKNKNFSSTNKKIKQQETVQAKKNSLESISKLIKQPIQTEKVVKYDKNKHAYKVAPTSIKSFLEDKKAQELKDKPINQENLPHKDFSKEDFFLHFKSYLKNLKKEGENNLYQTIKTSETVLNADYSFTITVSNEIQNREINSAKTNILNYLKSNLGNYSISLNVKVEHEINKVTNLTPHEQFLKMAEKNPALLTLKKKFDLDVDF